MAKCECGAKIPFLDWMCEKCAEKRNERLAEQNGGDASDAGRGSAVTSSQEESPPALSILLYVLAALSLTGGFILGGKLWPGDPGYGRSWETIAYIPALTWISLGVVQFAILAAFGKALEYLKLIASNTSYQK